MASTFSPSLKLELIGNGDQSGTWGTTTNTNLGTLLEQAITGVRAITMVNANYTLTDLNGISDEARNAVLVVGGTNSAIRSVIAPAVNKQYIIKNSTVGGFAIIIQTASSTGITIANGATQTVYCDGTEFYVGVDTVLNSTNAVNVTGTIASAVTGTTQTFGDSTTSLATTAFVQAALQALYPVGCIYTSTVATNPNSIFGFGTWVAFATGQVLIGAGTGWIAGAVGGSANAIIPSHSHSATSVVTDPGHAHGYDRAGSTEPQSGNSTQCLTNPATTHPNTDTATTGITVATSVTTTGVSVTNANLQPYIVVYMWNRTA